MYHGDIRLGDTIDIKFCTVTTTGAPTTLAGTPVVSAYVDNGTVELTAGITLTVDFDTRTGLNNVRVVATGANGYAAGTNVQLVITTGTVGGTSVVGYVVGSFAIEARSALRPTVAGRALDVSAGGEAGVDWANVGTPGSTVSLSATTVATVTTSTNVTTVNGLAANVITAASMAADAGTEMAAAVWDRDATASQTQGTFGQAIGDPVADTDTIWGLVNTNLTATVGSRLAAADISLAGGAVTVGTNNDKTGYALGTGGIASTAFAAGAIDAAAIAANALGASELAQDAAREVADEILDRDLVGGASGNTRGVRNALRALRNRVAISAGTATIYQENDSTAAWTATVTTAAGNPLSEVDPA